MLSFYRHTLAAAPLVAHGNALKRYSSARGRRDLRTEALVSSDESEDSAAGIMVSDEDNEVGSMVAQSSSSVKAKEPFHSPSPPTWTRCSSYRRPRYFHSWHLHAMISLGLCLSRALVHHVVAIILLLSRGGRLR